jgi:hypothetical protein
MKVIETNTYKNIVRSVAHPLILGFWTIGILLKRNFICKLYV